jgi:hypothetical protein
VLFFTVRGWYAHVGTELVLASALGRRSATSQFFLCGGILDQCTYKPGPDPRVTRPLCWRCTGFAARMIAAAGFRTRRMDHYVEVAALRRRFHADTQGLSRDELLSFEHAGLQLGEFTIPSVHRALHSGSISERRYDVETLRGFVASAGVMTETADALLEAERPDVVVMSNGLFFEERIMLELARRRGIRTFVYERGIPVNTIITAVDRPVIPFDVDPLWRDRADRPLSDHETDALARMLRARVGGDVGVQRIWAEMSSDGVQVLRRQSLDPTRPISTLFTNLLWDTAVFRMDIAFEGMFDWIESTIEAFADLPEQQLVIRVHPAEVRLPLEETVERVAERIGTRFPVLPENVRVIPPEDSTNSYDLVSHSARVLTYASTIGLESALLGRTVIVSGDTHYRNRGFTLDVDDRAAYGRILADPTSFAALPPEERALAWRYGYTFFFEFMQPFPWLDDRSRATRRFVTELFTQLPPGEHELMDKLCNQILGDD